MLNGREKTLERKLPEGEQRWVVREHPEAYEDNTELAESGWRVSPET